MRGELSSSLFSWSGNFREKVREFQKPLAVANHVKVSIHMQCFSSISFEHNIKCAFFQFPSNLRGKGSTCHTLNVTSLF